MRAPRAAHALEAGAWWRVPRRGVIVRGRQPSHRQAAAPAGSAQQLGRRAAAAARLVRLEVLRAVVPLLRPAALARGGDLAAERRALCQGEARGEGSSLVG